MAGTREQTSNVYFLGQKEFYEDDTTKKKKWCLSTTTNTLYNQTKIINDIIIRYN